jgi:phosphohistidine phosphatase SixA
MKWVDVVVRWVYFRIAVTFKVNKLKRQLTNAGYSSGRIMAAVIRYRNMRADDFVLRILRKQTRKAIKNCNPKVKTSLAVRLTREQENKFAQILSAENPSIQYISVMGMNPVNGEIIIEITH